MISKNTLLQLEDLSKSYNQKKEPVWENVNLYINPGEIIGLIGENGSGKTTLFKSILGTISINSGVVHSTLDVEKDIGYLLEIELFNEYNAFDNLLLLGYYSSFIYSVTQINNVLELVGLLEHRNKKVKKFSFGMKQRLRLAAAIILNRKLLILDEPLVGMDPNGINMFLETIKKIRVKFGTAIILSTHQINEFYGLFDRFYYFSGRTLVESKKVLKHYEITVDTKKDIKVLLENYPIKIAQNKIIVENIDLLTKIIVSLSQQDVDIIDIYSHSGIINEVFK